MSEMNEIDLTLSREMQNGRELLLVFDRDGTLVPFCADPADAIMSCRLREQLNQLSGLPRVHVGIISARSLSQLKVDLPDGKQILAGNYGLEIECPSAGQFCHPEAQAARSRLEAARDMLWQKLPADFNTILEDHLLSLCLHFHKTLAAKQPRVHELVGVVEKACPQLYFRRLPSSYEVWSVNGWDKSHALDKMLHMCRLNPDRSLTLYAGDSRVDEPAFAWVNKHDGISILVGQRDSQAKFSLASPEEVQALIGRLLEKQNA
jgi:trehalose 6-phosphate phosphatase